MSQGPAANRGFLSARHIADIRKMVKIARSEGIPLTVHGVTVGSNFSTTSCPANTTEHDGAAARSTEAVEGTRNPPSRQQQKRAQRLATFNEGKRAAACGARWLPLVQVLLRRSRAKLRCDEFAGFMRAKLALRDRMRDFLRKAWTFYAQQRTRALPSPSCASEDLSVFGPSSFPDLLDDEMAFDEDIQAAIAASLSPSFVMTPRSDQGANRARHTPVKGGKKSRGTRSGRPLQPANRG